MVFSGFIFRFKELSSDGKKFRYLNENVAIQYFINCIRFRPKDKWTLEILRENATDIKSYIDFKP